MPAGLVLLAATVAGLLLSPVPGASATTFNPQLADVTFSTTAPNANPDVTVNFNLPAPSSNFSTQPGHLVSFPDRNLNIANAAGIPGVGAYIGSLSGVLTLGLANEGCNSSVPVTFDLVEASTGGVAIAPAGPETNLLANLAEDDGDLNNDTVIDEPLFAGNGIADGADAYPTFVRDSLDPDGAGPGGAIAPRARYFGTAFVANTLIAVYQVVVMDPGALTTFPDVAWMTTNWGYPALTFLQDPLGPPSRSAVTDFCNLTSSTLLRGITRDNACTPAPGPPTCAGAGAGFALRLASDGGCPGGVPPNECGSVRLTNPLLPQTIKWRQYSVSQRDWDSDAYLPELGDGHQNALDVCVGQANAGWDPRQLNVLSGQDADGDGLPAPCDPNDSQFNNDQDGDLWQNRIDNCPLVANAAPGGGGGTAPNTFQLDRDVGLATPAPDAGPRSDDIGPACDPNPTAVNGHYHATALVRNICIGAVTNDCSTLIDSDADGVANGFDNCINVPNGPNRWGPPPGFAQSQRDWDADGTLSVTGEISDVAARYGSVGGLPNVAVGYDARADVDYDNAIDIADLSIMAEYVFGSC
jgi:Thrombospondin type 3 repeat